MIKCVHPGYYSIAGSSGISCAVDIPHGEVKLGTRTTESAGFYSCRFLLLQVLFLSVWRRPLMSFFYCLNRDLSEKSKYLI